MAGNVAIFTSNITHSGTVVGPVSTTTFAAGQPILRQDVIWTCSVHGSGKTMVTFSLTRSDLDGKKIVREGDLLSCGATVINGAPNTIVRD